VPRNTTIHHTLARATETPYYSSTRGISSASSTAPTVTSPPAQIEFIANLVRFYRGEDLELNHSSEAKWQEVFGETPSYTDVPGLCKAATLAEIEAQGWSLNPGRYVGVAKGEDLSDEDFKEKLEALNEELEVLNAEARELEARIAENVVELLEA
jgi:type I restriction enzyme M protein